MSTTLTKDIRKHIQYKITAKKQGYYEKQVTQTFTEDNPVLDLGDLTPYDGLKYKADNSVPNYRTTTLDFSETTLPFADNTKQNLKMTKYCLHNYMYKYKIPEYRAALDYHFQTIGQGPKINQNDSDSNNHYLYGFDKFNCFGKILKTGTGTTDLNKITFTIKIKYKKTLGNNQSLFLFDGYFEWHFKTTDRLSNYSYGSGNTVFEDGKDYWIQFIYEPTQMIVNISTDGTNYTNEVTWTKDFTISQNMLIFGYYSSSINPFLGRLYYNQSSLVARYGNSSNPSVMNLTSNFIIDKIYKELNGECYGTYVDFNYTSLNNLLFYQSYDSSFNTNKNYTGFKTKCRVSKKLDFLVLIQGNTESYPFEIKGLLRIMPWKRNNIVRFSYKTSKTGSFIDKDISIQNADEWQNFNIKFKDTGISIGYSTTQGSTNYTYTDIPDAWFEEGEYDLAVNGYFSGDSFQVLSYAPMQIDLNGIPGLPFKTEEYQGILYNFEKMNPNSSYNCYCDSNRRVVLVDTASIDENTYTNIGTVNLDKVTQNNDDQVVGNPVIELDT